MLRSGLGETVLRISYMGTKRALSPIISKMVEDCRPGPFLDAFAGMCSIGSTIGAARQIWSNDLQVFSNTVAQALFCSIEAPSLSGRAAQRLRHYFRRNMCALRDQYADELDREARALRAADSNALQSIFGYMIQENAVGDVLARISRALL